jgi:hypothetical protein
MISLGIDPGRDGAAVLVQQDGHDLILLGSVLFADCLDPWTPTTVRDVLADLANAIAPVVGSRVDRVALEMAQAPRTAGGNTGSGVLGTGIRWGYLHSACCYLWPGASLWTPAASPWMAQALRDQPGEGKARAVALVQSRLPDLDLTPGRRRKPHDGLADAGALAIWALDRREK